MNLKNYKYIPILLLLLFSCRPVTQDQDKSPLRSTTEKMVNVNKYLVAKDSEQIKNYIHRRNWTMQVTQSALWYDIYHKNNGAKAEIGKQATLKYRVELLDGTLCYTSDSLGIKTFVIGKGTVESGLEEGILLLREGEKARFIMPPHLAHGFTGDNDKIGLRSIIFYDVELINLK